MKNILLILALLIPVAGFSQVRYVEVTNSNLKSIQNEWYKNREDKKESKKDFLNSLRYTVQGMNLVIIPDIYNPTKDTNLVSIEFIQDTNHFHKDYAFLESKCNIFDKNYWVGYVMDYMTDSEHVGVLLKKTHKDGTIKMVYIKMHLDITLLYCTHKAEKIFVEEPIINSYYEYDEYEDGFEW